MFTDFFNTQVFLAVAGFFTTFWADPNGRIFLVTFIAYSTSYMLYSGYMSWFAGGYGSLLLSQYGFTAIDFLSLIPTAFVFLSQSFRAFLKFFLRYLFIYVIFPALLFFFLAAIQGHYNTHFFPSNYTLASTGILMWLTGAWIGISPFRNNKLIDRLSVIACYVGVLLMILSTPFPSVPSSGSVNNPLTGITNLIFELAMLLIFFFFFILPFFAGQEMASTAVKEKLLSRLKKLTLTQELPIPGSHLLAENDKSEKKLPVRPGLYTYFFPEKESPIKPEFYTYTFAEEKPLYLVSSFSQTTVLYAPVETTGEERGRLILIASSMLCSLEISGAKVNK